MKEITHTYKGRPCHAALGSVPQTWRGQQRWITAYRVTYLDSKGGREIVGRVEFEKKALIRHIEQPRAAKALANFAKLVKKSTK